MGVSKWIVATRATHVGAGATRRPPGDNPDSAPSTTDMARRKRTRSPLPTLVLLAVVAAGGWAAWRYGPALLARFGKPTAGTTAGAALDVCARAAPAALAQELGKPSAEPRHVGAGADVPAAGACTWDFEGGSLVALWFTPASLARGKVESSGHAYFETVATGLEYAFKEPPATIEGLGDEAAAAGFGGGPELAQIVVRKGDDVVTLVVNGVDRAAAERAAHLIVR